MIPPVSSCSSPDCFQANFVLCEADGRIISKDLGSEVVFSLFQMATLPAVAHPSAVLDLFGRICGSASITVFFTLWLSKGHTFIYCVSLDLE